MSLAFTYLLIFLTGSLVNPTPAIPEKGVPLLKNFTPSDYNHQGKIWDIDTAPNGIVYMASNKGLLEYDGEKWKSYKGSDGITRSVYVANDSLIYTGSDLDFGVWKKTVNQDFVYTSLYPFKKDLNQISEEFWNIHSQNGNILFVSAHNIYVYNSNGLTKIPAPNKINSSFIVGDTLYFVDEKDGLYQLENLAPKHLSRFNNQSVPEVVGMYHNHDQLILVTKNAGLFRFASGKLIPLNNELSTKLEAANVFSFDAINENYVAFGTILKGIFISDLRGNIIHHVNKNKGLQNNTILSLHYSKDGKLWMGMDYGVSFLDLSNRYTFFYDYRGNFGTGYSALLQGNKFYLGTNQGLYQTQWSNLNDNTDYDEFKLIPGTKGQVWTLKNIDNQVWVGHDRGLFILRNNQLHRVGNQHGIWTIQRYKQYLLAGTYNGISIYEKQGSGWKFFKKMDLIVGSCNQILIKGGHTLWVNIPNFGVIRAELNDELHPEKRKIFLTKQFDGSNPKLRNDHKQIHVITSSHDYIYDTAANKFNDHRRTVIKSGVDDLLLPNAQSVQLNQNFEFYPVYNGFALKNLNVANRSPEFIPDLIFRNVKAFNNEKIINVHSDSDISYGFNNFNIETIVPNQDEVLYQYRNEESKEWSSWSTKNSFQLIGLEPGDHVLAARARVKGDTTSVATIQFHIQTPWYQSWYAYGMYLILVLLIIYLIYLWRSLSLDKQKENLLIAQRNSLQQQEELHQAQLQHIEEEKLQAEYEQVKAQLKTKTIELATKAKENDEKNRILLTLKEKFEKLEQQPESLKRKSKEIRNIIDSHIGSEDHTFEIQIDQLHQKFFEKLRQDFPDLTSYDLRLCAYIKIGFNSKEIASLLNIKPSSVYISRSRLRKKLNIETDEDLHSYLNSI